MSCYFGPISTPSPCHASSHISGPPKVCHTSRTLPQCLVVHAYTHMSQFTEVFDWGVCQEFFVWKVLSTPPPLLSEYIHYNRKLNITFNFRFHMYEKSVTSHALEPPPPVTNCHTFSDPLPSNMYFM